MRKITLSFVLCLLAAVAVCAQPNTAELKNALQLKLDEWHKAGSFPGATLGVALPNGESFGLAVGFSDREAKTAMKPTDRMLAGSVGKTFAAATALQLIKEGKIGLDDKVEKYLGREQWFPRLPNATDITVRQLMNHTSGLVRYEFKDQFTKDLTANPEKVWKPAELVAYLLDEKPPFEAGKGWDYSDTNYIVLGIIIEKVTGRKFYEEADRRLLKPLKLTDTIPQDGPRLKGLVQGYAGPNNPFGGTDAMIVNGKFAINPQFEWTGGGYVSTSHDLARWARMFYEGKAFSPDLLPQVVEGVAAPMLGRESKYGLGAIIRQTAAGISYGHSGFFPGYMTDMMYFPEQKIAVAVQVNTSVGRSLGKPLGRVLVEMMEVVTAKKSVAQHYGRTAAYFPVWPRDGRAVSDLPDIERDHLWIEFADVLAGIIHGLREGSSDSAFDAVRAAHETEDQTRSRGQKPLESKVDPTVVPSFFISHAKEDGDFAENLKSRMAAAGFTGWVDTDVLEAGADWRKEIDEALHAACAVILVLSPDGKNSEYVTYEWAYGLWLGLRVVPLLLRETPIHPRLEAFQYLDFTKSKSSTMGTFVHVTQRNLR